jgi:hypothetical protein
VILDSTHPVRGLDPYYASSAVRRRQLQAALRAASPQAFAPFTAREWMSSSPV